MRALLAAILVVSAAWSGYWLYGSRGVDRDLAAWLDARHDAGWVANYQGVKTRGFPNRFDTTIDAIELADPTTGVAWSAPFLRLHRLSYQPRHIIAVWPDQQRFAVPGARTDISSSSARGSFVFGSGPDWLLDRSVITAEGVTLASDKGWSSDTGTFRLASRPSERVPGAIDLGLDIKDFALASPTLKSLSDMGLVPAELGRVHVEAAVTFDAPWDRFSIEERRPRITKIDLHLAQVEWGAMELWAAGDLTVDAAGLLSGSITLKFTNWREMLELAKAAGWVGDGVAITIEDGLSLLSGLAGSSKTLDVPLTLTNGQAKLGPIPLGAVPAIQLR